MSERPEHYSGYTYRVFYVVYAVINLVQVKHEFHTDQHAEAEALAIAYKKAGFVTQFQRKTERTECTSEDLHIRGGLNEPRL